MITLADSSSTMGAAIAAYFLVIGIIMLAVVVFQVILYWRICAKAGYSGALGILSIIPIAGLVLLCILAFAEWPMERELNMLRQHAMAQQPPAYAPGGYQQQQGYNSGPQYHG